MTARQKKYGCLLVALLLAVVVGTPALWWAWKYYQLPELPDLRNYKTIEQRADRALAFAHRHNMNEHYVLFVDCWSLTMPMAGCLMKLRLFPRGILSDCFLAQLRRRESAIGETCSLKAEFTRLPACIMLERYERSS